MTAVSLLLWFGLLVLMPAVSESYGSGAPGDTNGAVCTTLTPGHIGTSTQTTPAPYGIAISPRTYMPGQVGEIRVTLQEHCGVPFQGFLLTSRYAEASMDENLRPGTFDNPPETRSTCSDGAVEPYTRRAMTHTRSTVNKHDLTFNWTPPPAGSGGHIVFRATFLQNKSTYWVDVHSELLVDSTLGQPSDTSGFVTPGSTTVAPGCPATTADPGTTEGETNRAETVRINQTGSRWLVVWLCVGVFLVSSFLVN